MFSGRSLLHVVGLFKWRKESIKDAPRYRSSFKASDLKVCRIAEPVTSEGCCIRIPILAPEVGFF
jgi:hypothetical protein